MTHPKHKGTKGKIKVIRKSTGEPNNHKAISQITSSDETTHEYLIDEDPQSLFLNEPSNDQYGSFHIEFSKIDRMIDYLGFNQSEVAELLDLDSSTVSRWKKKDSKLDKFRSSYLFKLDKLLLIGKRIFGNLDDLKKWLDTENVSLGNKKPIDVIKNNGVDKVTEVLHSLSWGNYL